MSALGFYIDGVLGELHTPVGDANVVVGISLAWRHASSGFVDVFGVTLGAGIASLLLFAGPRS